MTETPPLTLLTDQALARLRKLADGNGLAPDKIELIEAKEQIYTLEGTTYLVPFCEPHNARYAGAVRGKDRVVLSDLSMLHAEAQRRQRAFLDGRDWLPDAMAELKAAPGEGWGLDGAKITLPAKSVILAANEVCPSCQGRQVLSCEQCQGTGTVICSHCQGRGLENCYNCLGSGQSPVQPGQPCVICNGRRQIPCRFCRSSGRLTCPTCQGRRGTTCPACGGVGRWTEEIALACGVAINFKLTGEGLPSGLRRGLDRLGLANLAKGHADISLVMSEPPKEKDGAAKTEKTPQDSGIIRYRAVMPYADLKLRFGKSRAVVVSVFGKRAALLGVPPFLDDALQPWREQLKKAASGLAPLEAALKARAMRNALTLVLGGQGQVQNLRRIYPSGLSPKTAQEILLDMRRALHRFTRNVRLGVATGIGAACAALLAGFLLLPQHAQTASTLSWGSGLLLDLAALAAVMGLGWSGLGKAVQLSLKRRFPTYKIALRGNSGHIGQIMLLGIALVWLGILMAMPNKPLWLSYMAGIFAR